MKNMKSAFVKNIVLSNTNGYILISFFLNLKKKDEKNFFISFSIINLFIINPGRFELPT